MTEFLTDHGVIVAVVCALIAVAYGVLTTTQLLALSPGNDEMQRISGAVQEGARAYLNRQYTVIAAVGVVLFVALFFIQDASVAIGFLIGGLLSGAAGYIGMNVSVRANARVAESARGGISPALKVAFRGGAITGMLVVGLALFGVAAYYGILTAFFDKSQKDAVDALIGLGFGGSLISVFARLGGGIFTKAADVGADLVGKVEAGIPEDDPRNPAVIADNVGDNVGDCAGMAADLFETYAVTAVAVMLLGVLTFQEQTAVALYPLVLGGAAIVASIIGTFAVRTTTGNVGRALYQGVIVSGISAAIAVYPITGWRMDDLTFRSAEGALTVPSVMDLYLCSLVGIAVTALLLLPMVRAGGQVPAMAPSEAASGAADGQRFALVIGVSNSDDARFKDLSYADSDARALASVLVDPTRGRCARENVRLLTSDGSSSLPTKNNIFREMQWLRANSGPNDLILVFFAMT